MNNPKKEKNNKTLSKIYKDLNTLYALIEIEQESLDLCIENGKNCEHITCIIDIIQDKFRRVITEFKGCINE